MTFFEINPANKEIKIHTQLLKEFLSNTGTGISDIGGGMRRFAQMNLQITDTIDSKLSYTPCYALVPIY